MIEFTPEAEKNIEKAALDSINFFDMLEAEIEPAKPETERRAETVGDFWESLESDYPSTYKERVDKTPAEGKRGHWEGGRGESTYIPSEERIKAILGRFGLEGIAYKDGIPDFSRCAEAEVEIENMSANRVSGNDCNYHKADIKCAEQWNEEARDGKTDWTFRDVSNWRRENGYSWHECNDRKTCQLVPAEINDYFGHLGGVSECGKANSQEDIFDE